MSDASLYLIERPIIVRPSSRLCPLGSSSAGQAQLLECGHVGLALGAADVRFDLTVVWITTFPGGPDHGLTYRHRARRAYPLNRRRDAQLPNR